MGKIVIFGAGKMASELLMKFELQSEIFDDTIVGVLDNDINKKGSRIHGYSISLPNELSGISFDYIVIACNDFEEIVRQLKNDGFVETETIVCSKDYSRRKVCEYQMKQNSERTQFCSPKEWDRFDQESMVVYTAIIGDYDDLKDPDYINPLWKYVCFTNNRFLKSDVWEVRYVENTNKVDAPLFVRRFKICPHIFFPEYNTSIWIDANLQIKKDLAILLLKYQKFADILFFPHPDRICIFDEGITCAYWRKDSKERILYQMKKYVDESYPFDNGLLYGGFIVRNHNKTTVIQAMEKWWLEVMNGSRRDQISLPYALWKTNIVYDLIDLNYLSNDFFQKLPHRTYS